MKIVLKKLLKILLKINTIESKIKESFKDLISKNSKNKKEINSKNS